MDEKKKHKVFVNGAISPNFIAEAIAKHSSKTNISAHDIFLGQVREDIIKGETVQAIEYTADTEMAEEKLHKIREAAFSRFNLSCMHIYHSLGEVKIGEISFFVFVSSKDCKEAFDACRFIVEEVKANVLILEKEIFENETHTRKINID